jgi:hypothetical protein
MIETLKQILQKKINVQIYDYKKKKSRILFGPDLVILGPSEEFTLISGNVKFFVILAFWYFAIYFFNLPLYLFEIIKNFFFTIISRF